MIGLHHYLLLAAVLFVSGLLTVLLKRNAIGVLMGVELMLNAANLNLVAFNLFSPAGSANLDGQMFAVFVIVIAAAEAAAALAIFMNYYRQFRTIDVEQAVGLNG